MAAFQATAAGIEGLLAASDMFRVASSQGLRARRGALSLAHGTASRDRGLLSKVVSTRGLRLKNRAYCAPMQNPPPQMKANIATMRGLGGGSFQSAADRRAVISAWPLVGRERLQALPSPLLWMRHPTRRLRSGASGFWKLCRH